MDLSVRDADARDANTIVAFNSAIALETEGRELDPALIGAGVAAILKDPAKGRYWVAESDSRIIGQIMVTNEWSDWRNGMMWWIQSVYVHSDFRRQGVFSNLYRHVESLARQDASVCGLRLYVEKDNLPAQQVYLALGMTHPGYQVMEADFRETEHASG
ncbi:MAG: GNAT family N-acetyltransferase [Woeseia sp.]|nr:GNAT family N-acetyltransferase [Woeseia sp.]MBT8095673.1 GNAT family N-acetyltransferase [Woeseia sp.]NNE60352.1 GNAT family N-acetyltransferase [Woeseia sp.]NNL54657.1 GNAT family N-acetyltransferase [Woeseia sp.]